MNKTNLSFLAISIAVAPLYTFAQTVVFGDTNTGTIAIGGNAEFNLNYRDRETRKFKDADENKEIDQDGRLLLEFTGEKVLDNGLFVGFKGQPLLNTKGSVSADDAYVEFGRKKSWSIKTGRFEGYNMFPKTGDVFLEYSGNTSNSLYIHGAPYSYQGAEVRGRGKDGQIMFSKTLDNLYLELNLLLGDRTGLFQGNYQDFVVNKNASKDTIAARPVISYQLNNFNFAVAAETNLISDAIVGSKYDPVTKKEILAERRDISDRTGYSGKITWDNGTFVVNAMYNNMNALNETNQTYGLTGGYKDLIGLGYIQSMNQYDNAKWKVGDLDVSTFYASYAFRNALSIDNFSVLLGGYYSKVSNKLDKKLTPSNQSAIPEDNDAGFRIRFRYDF